MMCEVLYFQQESRPLTVHASFILFGNNFTVYVTIFILIFFIFFMLQDSWWKSLVDGCKNSPSFASSSSAPSPSHGSSPPEQGTSTKSPQISNILSNNLWSSSLFSVQLLPENVCFFTFLFSFCFFFFSLTISRSSMVSSKESPDFVACGGNGSFTTTWQRNVKSNTTAFDNSFTALLISVIFGNFRLLSVVVSKYWQH